MHSKAETNQILPANAEGEVGDEELGPRVLQWTMATCKGVRTSCELLPGRSCEHRGLTVRPRRGAKDRRGWAQIARLTLQHGRAIVDVIVVVLHAIGRSAVHARVIPLPGLMMGRRWVRRKGRFGATELLRVRLWVMAEKR